MNVRTANENDAEAISLLMDQLGYQASAKLIADKIKQFRNSTNDAVYVTENDKVVGAVSCHIISLFHQKGDGPQRYRFGHGGGVGNGKGP